MKRIFGFVVTFCVMCLPLFAQKTITEVFPDLHHIHKWDNSQGDTWDPFWADDDNLYAFNCDGRGFGSAEKTSNLSFNLLRGYKSQELTGSMLNRMDEYGRWAEKGPDMATWKALGQECIDGIFYAFVSRHTYGSMSNDDWERQTARNTSLIKSEDKGITWTRSAKENYDDPMWPGDRFGTPFFVHYGKNGGNVTKDGADKYVYAISNNGFWDNGDDYIIGRILRTQLPRMNVSDWTYFAGGDAENDANWVKDINLSKPILSLPLKCGSGPACYVPSLDTYIMVVWYSSERLPAHFDPSEMTFDFYQAKHPWGPWNYISTLTDDFLPDGQHMYAPSLCAKFQEPQTDGTKISMFVSGCPFEDIPIGLYKMWEIPLILKTTPVKQSVMVNGDDKQIKYHGSWNVVLKQRDANYNHDLHYTDVKGDYLEYTFTGAGIEYIAQKDPTYGQLSVYLDGALVEDVNLKLVNFPRISKIKVFSIDGLKQGSHTIKIVNTSNSLITLDGFNVIK